MHSLRAFLLSSVALCSVALGLPARGDVPVVVDAAGLFAALAKMPGLEAEFVEEKSIALLAAPLISTGRLFFLPPGTLARLVERPIPSTVVITPKALRISGSGHAETIDLGARPDVKLFVESFVKVLAGDLTALETLYSVSFVLLPGGQGAWRLTLTPRGGAVKSLIASLELTGRGPMVDEIIVKETGGDETVTRITKANPARAFSPEEQGRLFGPP